MNLAALYNITYGIYIVASELDGRPNGQLANSMIQVTSQPPKLLACINKQNLTHEFIEKSGFFSVSVLSADTPMKFLGIFGFRSGRDIDKFQGIDYKKGKNGTPIVMDNALCYFELKLSDSLDVGTHTLFVGEVVDADVIKSGEPMTYAYYHNIKKGKTPQTAPHYVAPDVS
ncbi:MAG: flavin reductase [Desulfococcus sp. 4484_241]|nr:MAG: flavin reductase [Desulfococcus sp. 4484_241]